MTSENRSSNPSLDAKIAELVQLNLSGPGSAAYLFQQGVTLEDTLYALQSLGFYAYSEKNVISISKQRYEGEVHPHLVSSKFDAEHMKGWLSEIE